MATSFIHRTCPETGLKVHSQADALIKANAVIAVIFLAIGGLFGLLVALTRWPAVHLLDAELFYLALTAHGATVLIFWIIFFEVAILYFASAILLNTRLVLPKVAWTAFALMIIGSLMAVVAVLQGESSVMFTSYVPMKAAPHFYLGLILFAVGTLFAVGVFFGTIITATKEKTYTGSLPLVTFGAVTAAIIAVFTILAGAVILVPTFFWSLDIIPHIDSLTYKIIWWAFGHSSQQINVATHVAVWYCIAAMVLGAKPLSEKVSRAAFLLYILFLQLASAHHLLVDPGISSSWKIFNTSYAIYLAVLGSLIHGLSVPGAIEAAQRKRGFNKGTFEWLRKAPWGNPAFSGMFLSLIFFGFLGGISGVTMGTEQINLIIHNTIYVPGHFHATVVAGTTLAFMAITYLIIPLIFQREVMFPTLAKWQPYLFGIGAAGTSLFMMGAGTVGIARRHWDITFSDAPLTVEVPGTAFMMMGLNGIFAILATIGGIAYVVVVVGSVFFGKKRTEASIKANPTVIAGGTEAVAGYGNAEHPKLTGTIVLVALLFVTFVLYYYVNWKFLSEVWPLS